MIYSAWNSIQKDNIWRHPDLIEKYVSSASNFIVFINYIGDMFVCFIVLWSVYGECENISVMTGHTGAVMELHFSPDGMHLYTASTDHTLGLWDIPTGQRIKKFKGHTTFVNSIQRMLLI